MRLIKNIGWIICLIVTNQQAFCQDKLVIDEVIAIVGNTPILRSELDFQVSQMDPDVVVTEKMRCEILQQMLIDKMMVHQAEIDSLLITDEEVYDNIDNKLRFFERQIGSLARLEASLGMSVPEYRKLFFPRVKEQMLKTKMQEKIIADIKITPKEVRDFYKKIPVDSLPFMSSEVELAQIVIKPSYSKEAKLIAKEQLQELRERILSGESFAKLASYYSEDPGSKRDGGFMPEFGRGEMVPEFERAAFTMNKDSVSEIIETQFGYHIIKLLNRRGEKVTVRHILIRPKLIDNDLAKAKSKMDSVLNLLRTGKLNFCDAVKFYSQDEETKPNCGFFTDPNIGSQRLPFDYLDKDMAATVSALKPGEYSEPEVAYSQDGSAYYRLFYLKRETKPHVANLELDWQRIQNMAIEEKKEDVLDQWANSKRKKTYIYINTAYLNCVYFDEWLTKN